MNENDLNIIVDNKISNPSHYTLGRKYEPIKVINDWGLGFNLGNVIKYISRAGRKDDITTDLSKSLFYLIYECKEKGVKLEEIERSVRTIYE